MSENILQPTLEKNLDAVLSDEEYAALPTLAGADPKLLAEAIAEVLESRRGRDVKVIFVEDKTDIAEYFVLCTGNSNTQIKSYSGELEFRLGECGLTPLSIEGFNEASWIVMDYGPVIIHIFNRETRNFYNLEKLWEEGTEIDISDLVTEK